jgi:hypothetical protein
MTLVWNNALFALLTIQDAKLIDGVFVCVVTKSDLCC